MIKRRVGDVVFSGTRWLVGRIRSEQVLNSVLSCYQNEEIKSTTCCTTVMDFHGLIVLPAPHIQRSLARNETNHVMILNCDKTQHILASLFVCVRMVLRHWFSQQWSGPGFQNYFFRDTSILYNLDFFNSW